MRSEKSTSCEDTDQNLNPGIQNAERSMTNIRAPKSAADLMFNLERDSRPHRAVNMERVRSLKCWTREKLNVKLP